MKAFIIYMIMLWGDSLYHLQELLFSDDGHSEFLGILKFGRSHIVACEHEGCLGRDTTSIFAPVLFDERFVFVARMLLENTADDYGVARQTVALLSKGFLGEL